MDFQQCLPEAAWKTLPSSPKWSSNRRTGERALTCAFQKKIILGFYVPESVKEEHFYKSPTFDV
jgi:hypothetical protein